MPDAVEDIAEDQAKARLLDFVHFLRDARFDVGIQDAVQMGVALQKFDRPDREGARTVFRTLCCRSLDDWNRFGEVFDDFWFSREVPDVDSEPGENTTGNSSARVGIAGIGGVTEQQSDLYDPGKGAAAGAGRQNTLSQADFRFLNDRSAMHRMEHVAEQLANSIRPRTSRRRKLSRLDGQLALRHTMRKSVHTGGETLKRWNLRRRTEPRELVILHDVSHSMTFNNPLLIRFTRGLSRRLKKTEIFVFHTRLFRATEIFRETTLSRMREALERNNRLWLGGTCIADSLQQFSDEYARQVLKPGSVVIIISDGFDTNDPNRLAAELRRIKSKCAKLLWLNPMLEREGFNADKEEVWNIRRSVDYLLPAHSLESLRSCVGTIR